MRKVMDKFTILMNERKHFLFAVTRMRLRSSRLKWIYAIRRVIRMIRVQNTIEALVEAQFFGQEDVDDDLSVFSNSRSTSSGYSGQYGYVKGANGGRIGLLQTAYKEMSLLQVKKQPFKGSKFRASLQNNIASASLVAATQGNRRPKPSSFSTSFEIH